MSAEAAALYALLTRRGLCPAGYPRNFGRAVGVAAVSELGDAAAAFTTRQVRSALPAVGLCSASSRRPALSNASAISAQSGTPSSRSFSISPRSG